MTTYIQTLENRIEPTKRPLMINWYEMTKKKKCNDERHDAGEKDNYFIRQEQSDKMICLKFSNQKRQ